MRLYSFFRSLDIFSTPVGIRYKESKDYQTGCGGALSLVALIMILFFSSTEIWSFIEGNQYNESMIIENLNYDNTVEYTISDT